MRNIEKATPLIVCGRQRAGTRFVTNLLNSFEDVTLQGEIPNPVMRAAERFVRDSDKYYANNAKSGRSGAKQLELWQSKRPLLMFDIWAGVSQAPRAYEDSGCRYYGYKRPNNEFYFDLYEDIFLINKPQYIYCLRSFSENFLSISSRWPDRSIEQVAEDYMSSLDQFQKMRDAAPGRVHLFNLDAHIVGGWEYTEAAILEPLGLVPHDETHRQQLISAGPINTTERDAKKPRRRELTKEEMAFLAQSPELAQKYEEAVRRAVER